MTTDAPLTKCDNCTRPIGKLEPRYAWQQHTVCAECFQRLSATPSAATSSATPATPAATPVAVPPVYGTMPANMPAAIPAGAAPAPAPTDDATAEKIVFEGHPSIVIYIGSLTLSVVVTILGLIGVIYFFRSTGVASALRYLSIAAIVGGLGMLLVRYLQIEYIKYRLSNQRLFITTGILSRRTIETELFRVRDISVQQTLLERILGIGTIHALTTDKDIPHMDFLGIQEPLKIKELLRQYIMEARQRTRTRDLDVADIDSSGSVF